MPVMHVMRGIPGSGKSTKASAIISKYTKSTQKLMPRTNRDEIRLAYPEWKESQVVKYERELIHSYFNSGVDFIVDNTHTNENKVKGLRDLAEQYNYSYEIHEMHTPLMECISRDLVRKEKVGKSVILKMACDIGWYDNDPYWSLLDDRAVIFDIDGTLANTEHRQHFIVSKPKDWKGFFNAAPLDPVHYPIRNLFHIFRESYHAIICVSGRPSEYRKATEKWLEDNGLNPAWLLMRGFNDKRDDDVIKKELYEKYIKPRFDVKYVVDDRNRVVKMWRSLGLTCLQCAEGDF
jgi:predicted kinase